MSSSWVPRLDNRARSLLVLTDPACHAQLFLRMVSRIRRLADGGAQYDERLPMLARVDLRGSTDLRRALARPPAAADDVGAAVAAIIADVRHRGDAALREYTQRFDGCELDALAVRRSESWAALERLDPALRAALELARDQIAAWLQVVKRCTNW